MSRLAYQGPLRHRIAAFLVLNRLAFQVALRHATLRRMAQDWDIAFEIGIRFWRHQFTKAMTRADPAEGRAVLAALNTLTDEKYAVTERPETALPGVWMTPETVKSDRVLLYLHGGGYGYREPTAPRFAAMLAHHCGTRLFMPHYRLTPEHPHPAQAEDALAAWQHVTQTTSPEKIVVIGDSAGGHMALMLLQTLKVQGVAQPALCIGMCPWTDIGARGDSMTTNNQYDMVQGWMAVEFGRWLDPDGRFGREALSPIAHDYTGCAPIYLQAGGREMLRDMIRDFAKVQKGLGADVTLDEWADMPHDFQLYDSLKASSTAAVRAIREKVLAA